MQTSVPIPRHSLTRFAGWGRTPARAVLLATAAFLGLCLWAALTRETVPARPANLRGDTEFYRAIVDRVHSGQGYYDAVDQELRQWGYPPHSLFNWRPPLYAWLFGNLPDPAWGQALLGLGVLTTMLLAFRAAGHRGMVHGTLVVVLLVGPFAWAAFPDVALFTELWAGMLIALSVAAYALGRSGVAVAAGVLALFFRELALPYALIATALAWWEGRRREALVWLAGLGFFVVYLALHATQVAPRLARTDLVHAGGWLQWNGLPFALLTCQINFFLIQAPAWLAAVYLPLGFLGLAAWRGPAGARAALTTAAFAVAFLAVGFMPHNAYWGLLYAPLLPFGIVWAPRALRDLIGAAFQTNHRGTENTEKENTERTRSKAGQPPLPLSSFSSSVFLSLCPLCLCGSFSFLGQQLDGRPQASVALEEALR